ncbi:MAG: VCBS repeat-containing protein [Phaeodactylibacter sp.]|nr:VCBS repeat-containing protein [Phaeodactylibacter sp.]
MKKMFTILLLIELVVSIRLDGQSFTEQILNKEPFQSAASLLQDYDNDGDLDIIVTRWDPAGVYVLENDATRQFPATPIITEDLNFYMADIDAADLDNDGDVDYVVSFTGVDDGELAWFQKQANGTYIKWTIATNKDFIMADVGDLNGDGFVDIVAVGLGNSDKEGRLYWNQGNVFFTEEIVATSNVIRSVDVDDIDNDGDLDIAFGGSGLVQNGDDGARLLVNDGGGNFTVGAYLHCWGSGYNDCGGSQSLKIADLNGDGHKDVVAFGAIGTGGLYWLDGSNNFAKAIIDEEGNIDIGGDLVVFDVDGDGDMDIVRQEWGDKVVTILYQTTPMNFVKQYLDVNWSNCCNPTAKMSVGDLDNDGDLDLVFPEQGSVDRDISWYENISGQLYKHQIYGQWDGVRIAKFADWDHDGDLDIFATVASDISATEDELILYENIDGENFINWRLNDRFDSAADIEFADIDGDGDLDIFATAADADDLAWLRNDGFQANWVTDTIFPEGNTPLGIATDDLDGDGDADVVMCSRDDNKVFGFLNNGSGTFSPIVVDASIDGPREVEIADLDNDGDKDIAVVASGTSNTLVVYLNNGSASFSEQILFSGKSGRDIEIGDWNGDGHPDIFISLYASSGTALLRDVMGFYNDGNAGFTSSPLLAGAEKGLGLRLGDLDNDGDLDLVLGFDGDSRLYAAINNGTAVEVVALSDISEGSVNGIDIGDVNNDGTPDIVYADFERDDLILLTIGCLVPPSPAIVAEDARCNENNGAATIDLSIFNDPSVEWSNGETSAAITNLEAGDYEVTITDSNGCSVTETITIEDIPVAEIEVSGTNTTCGNEDGTASVNVISGNVASYNWSNGGNTAMITGLAGGAYSVTATDENNCEITNSVEVEALINPSVGLGDDIAIEEGQSATLDATGDGWVYEWSTGETSPTIVVMEAGIYAVTVTNAQGCTATDEIGVTVITSIEVLGRENAVALFPNPATDKVLVIISDERLAVQGYKLINSSGKTIRQVGLGKDQNSFEANLEGLPGGLYLICIITDEGHIWRRMIKN